MPIEIVFRTQGTDWDKFLSTVRTRRGEIEDSGCTGLWLHRNRSHPEEWMMVQRWPDKPTFDRFAEMKGKQLDSEAGVRWTDVSTWEEVNV